MVSFHFSSFFFIFQFFHLFFFFDFLHFSIFLVFFLFFSLFFVFPFPLFLFLHFFHFLFFIFQSSEQTPKSNKNRRTVPFVKMTISFCESSMLGSRWTVGGGLGKAHLRISFKKFSLLAIVSEFNGRCFLRGRCSMEMWCPDDIGRDGWDWVGPHTWEHDSTPHSGVETPRLLKRSFSRLYYCCCCFGHE